MRELELEKEPGTLIGVGELEVGAVLRGMTPTSKDGNDTWRTDATPNHSGSKIGLPQPSPSNTSIPAPHTDRQDVNRADKHMMPID